MDRPPRGPRDLRPVRDRQSRTSSKRFGHQAIDKGRTVAWHTPETLAQLLRRHRVDDSVNKAIGKLIASISS
jgi:hypothetical protein